MNLPFHNEDKSQLINAVFGNYPLDYNGMTVEETKVARQEIALAQLDLIKKEIDEVQTVQTEDDMRDVLCDILVTAYGLPYRLGLGRVAPIIKMMIAYRGDNDQFPIHRSLTVRDVYLWTMQSRLPPQERTKYVQHTDYFHETQEPEMRKFLLEAFNNLYRAYLDLHRNTAGEYKENEMCDALARLVINAHTLAFAIGTNIDRDMDEVCGKLLSRLARDEDVAEETIEFYKSRSIETTKEPCEEVPGRFIIRCTEDGVYNATGEEIPKLKFLKSLAHQTPVFYELPRDMNLVCIPKTTEEQMNTAAASEEGGE